MSGRGSSFKKEGDGKLTIKFLLLVKAGLLFLSETILRHSFLYSSLLSLIYRLTVLSRRLGSSTLMTILRTDSNSLLKLETLLYLNI